MTNIKGNLLTYLKLRIAFYCKTHLRATEPCLPYKIIQLYLRLNTGEYALEYTKVA